MFIQTFPLCTLKVHSMKNIVDHFSIDYYTTSFFECLSNGSVRERKATFLIKKDFFRSHSSGRFRWEKIFEISRLVSSCGSHRKSVFSFTSGTALCRRNCSTVFRIQSPATFLQPPQQAKRLRHRITPTSTRRPRIWEREEGGNEATKVRKFFFFSFSLLRWRLLTTAKLLTVK